MISQNSNHKTKVAFNISPLAGDHEVRGIGTYTKNLLTALKKLDEVEIQEFSDIEKIKDADVVHYPFFDLFSHTLPVIKKFPTVVTIHDVIPLAFPKAFPPGIKGFLNNFLQKISLNNVAAVITDSEASRKDIREYLGVASKKIYVVPLAPSPHFKAIDDKTVLNNVKRKYSLPDKFALFTGSVNFNKNLLNLTEGVIKAEIDIVFVGKGFETRNNLNHPELRSFAVFLEKFAHHPRVHILGFVKEEDLVAITNLAQVLLLPSLKEGFGLPILEAQACGTPVITSETSSMPEVAGDGALFVNPYNIVEIANAIVKVLYDDKLRDQLIRKGFENVKRFSWEKTAANTVKVYRYVLQK